jgi:hypothetical protein
MGIRTSSIALGATFSPTGGTATAFSTLSSNDQSIKGFLAESGVTPLTRKEVTFEGKPSRANASSPGGYTQGRASAKLAVPKVLANLARTVNTMKVELSVDPETTDAEVTAMKSAMINLINDTDFSQLWLNQSID